MTTKPPFLDRVSGYAMLIGLFVLGLAVLGGIVFLKSLRICL